MMCARWVSRSTTAFASRASGNTLVHSPNGRFVVTIRRAAFVALGDDLEDELGGAVGQARGSPSSSRTDELGAGVAADDAGELFAALGFLELVRERGEGGEADAASLLAGADRERAVASIVLPVPSRRSGSRLAVIDPGALGERGDRGLRDLRVVGEAEVLQAFDLREPRVDQPRVPALSALGHLGFEQRGEVGDRGLLLAQSLPRRARGSGGGRSGVSARSRAPRSAPPSPGPSRGAHRRASRAAGRSRSSVGSGRLVPARVGQISRSLGRWDRSARRASTATARPSIAPAASAPRTASSTRAGPCSRRASARRPSAGRPLSVRSARSAPPTARRSSRASCRGRAPGAARATAAKRAGLVGQQLEVVVELARGAEAAVQPLMTATSLPSMVRRDLRAPIFASTRAARPGDRDRVAVLADRDQRLRVDPDGVARSLVVKRLRGQRAQQRPLARERLTDRPGRPRSADPDRPRSRRAARVQLGEAPTLGTGTRWRRRNRPTSPSTPPFSCAPSIPGS
jgi:hypothetical protein